MAFQTPITIEDALNRIVSASVDYNNKFTVSILPIFSEIEAIRFNILLVMLNGGL